MLNHWQCPITTFAKKYTTKRGNNFAIFLPGWLAHNTMIFFTILFGIGMFLVVYNVISTI
jgi:hypothetical protein